MSSSTHRESRSSSDTEKDQPPSTEGGRYRPFIFRLPVTALLLAFILVLIGLVEYACRSLPTDNWTPRSFSKRDVPVHIPTSPLQRRSHYSNTSSTIENNHPLAIIAGASEFSTGTPSVISSILVQLDLEPTSSSPGSLPSPEIQIPSGTRVSHSNREALKDGEASSTIISVSAAVSGPGTYQSSLTPVAPANAAFSAVLNPSGDALAVASLARDESTPSSPKPTSLPNGTLSVEPEEATTIDLTFIKQITTTVQPPRPSRAPGRSLYADPNVINTGPAPTPAAAGGSEEATSDWIFITKKQESQRRWTYNHTSRFCEYTSPASTCCEPDNGWMDSKIHGIICTTIPDIGDLVKVATTPDGSCNYEYYILPDDSITSVVRCIDGLGRHSYMKGGVYTSASGGDTNTAAAGRPVSVDAAPTPEVAGTTTEEVSVVFTVVASSSPDSQTPRQGAGEQVSVSAVRPGDATNTAVAGRPVAVDTAPTPRVAGAPTEEVSAIFTVVAISSSDSQSPRQDTREQDSVSAVSQATPRAKASPSGDAQSGPPDPPSAPNTGSSTGEDSSSNRRQERAGDDLTDSPKNGGAAVFDSEAPSAGDGTSQQQTRGPVEQGTPTDGIRGQFERPSQQRPNSRPEVTEKPADLILGQLRGVEKSDQRAGISSPPQDQPRPDVTTRLSDTKTFGGDPPSSLGVSSTSTKVESGPGPQGNGLSTERAEGQSSVNNTPTQPDGSSSQPKDERIFGPQGAVPTTGLVKSQPPVDNSPAQPDGGSSQSKSESVSGPQGVEPSTEQVEGQPSVDEKPNQPDSGSAPLMSEIGSESQNTNSGSRLPQRRVPAQSKGEERQASEASRYEPNSDHSSSGATFSNIVHTILQLLLGDSTNETPGQSLGSSASGQGGKSTPRARSHNNSGLNSAARPATQGLSGQAENSGSKPVALSADSTGNSLNPNRAEPTPSPGTDYLQSSTPSQARSSIVSLAAGSAAAVDPDPSNATNSDSDPSQTMSTPLTSLVVAIAGSMLTTSLPNSIITTSVSGSYSTLTIPGSVVRTSVLGSFTTLPLLDPQVVASATGVALIVSEPGSPASSGGFRTLTTIPLPAATGRATLPNMLNAISSLDPDIDQSVAEVALVALVPGSSGLSSSVSDTPTPYTFATISLAGSLIPTSVVVTKTVFGSKLVSTMPGLAIASSATRESTSPPIVARISTKGTPGSAVTLSSPSSTTTASVSGSLVTTVLPGFLLTTTFPGSPSSGFVSVTTTDSAPATSAGAVGGSDRNRPDRPLRVMTASRYFTGSYLSTFLAVIILAKDFVNLNYLSTNDSLDPFVAMVKGHWLMLSVSVLYFWIGLLTPFASELLIPTKFCNIHGVCGSEVRVISGIARVLESLLGVSAFILIVFGIFQWKYRSGLYQDPSSIAAMASLLHNQSVVDDFRGVYPDATQKEMETVLVDKRYHLTSYAADGDGGSTRYGLVHPNNDGDEVQESSAGHRELYAPRHADDDKENAKRLKYRRSRQRIRIVRDVAFALLVVGTMSLVIADHRTLSTKGFWGFFNGEGFGPRFVLSCIGILIQMQWKQLERETCILEPFRELAKGHAPPRKSILVTRTLHPITTLFTSLWRRQFFPSLLAFTALLSEILIVALPGVPFRSNQMYGSYLFSFWTSIAIMAFMLAVLAILHLRPRAPALPRTPNTLGSVFSYLCESRLMIDLADLGTANAKTQRAHIKQGSRTFVLKQKVTPADGLLRWTIDYDDDGDGDGDGDDNVYEPENYRPNDGIANAF